MLPVNLPNSACGSSSSPPRRCQIDGSAISDPEFDPAFMANIFSKFAPAGTLASTLRKTGDQTTPRHTATDTTYPTSPLLVGDLCWRTRLVEVSQKASQRHRQSQSRGGYFSIVEGETGGTGSTTASVWCCEDPVPVFSS